MFSTMISTRLGSFRFITLFILSLVAYANAVYADTRIVILGDSLSASYGMKQQQGWVHLLQEEYKQEGKDIKLINASISGETTAGGLSRVDAVLQKHQANVLLIELGGNDGLRGFPIKKMKNNLLQIIQVAQKRNITVLLMQIEIPPNYGRRYTEMFRQVYPQLAKQEKLKLVPFFMRDIADKPHLMQSDQIHPNQAAQPLIKDTMKKNLQNSLFF